MTIEDTIGAVLESKLAPLKEQVGQLSAQLEALRRALPPALVSVPEAARLLGLSVSSVRRRVKEGTLPSKRIGSAVRVDLAGLHQPDEAEVLRLAQSITLR